VLPSDLRLLAARLTAELERLPPGGQRDALAVAIRAALREADALDGLMSGDGRGTTVEPMLPAARVRHSGGASKDRKTKAFAKVANAAGHTLRSVAEAVRRKFGQGSHVNVGRALRGDRAIQERWAKHIQDLTRSEAFPDGWEATPENWPGGWSRD
jgi:hypothetical protein